MQEFEAVLVIGAALPQNSTEESHHVDFLKQLILEYT